MSNLVSLCGSAVTGCHGRCEERNDEMHQRGMWVNGWESPEDVPVVRWDGTTVKLLNCGTYEYA